MTPYPVNVTQVARVAEHLRQAAEAGKSVFPEMPTDMYILGFLMALLARLLEKGETAGELQLKTADEAAEAFVRNITLETNRPDLN